MLSVYEIRKTMIENTLNEKDMNDLNSIMVRIGTEAANGKYGVYWEENRLYSDTIEWALKKLGYRFKQTDCLSHYSYEILW